MSRKGLLVLLAVVLSLVVAMPALAIAPAGGLVVEGESVPGIALGFTRAQVGDAYGSPNSCQSVGVQADYASCSFLVDGGGLVRIRYRAADGSQASNSPDDVVYVIRWDEPVSGWTTTAGVNTMLARTDADAVIAAYPNGQVTYNSLGNILQVRDYELGIQVDWVYHFYSGTSSVSMGISAPGTPPPPREKLVRAAGIELATTKTKGKRLVTSLVQVKDDRTLAGSGATVFATWSLPDGTTLAVQDVTSSSGYAYFEIRDASRGSYALEVTDVIVDEHRFDAANSVLKANIRVK